MKINIDITLLYQNRFYFELNETKRKECLEGTSSFTSAKLIEVQFVMYTEKVIRFSKTYKSKSL